MPELNPSIAQHYHERTKYDPKTLAGKSHQLDWGSQPIPFKEYKIGKVYNLKPYLQHPEERPQVDFPVVDPSWWQRLSLLLIHSYGLTAMLPAVTMTGEPMYLRTAPSAGGLYPAEVYLISRGTPELPAGLYSYQPKIHSLVRFWDSDIWTGLQAACFWPQTLEGTQMALVTTAIFFRSAWRYQDRAYRRIFLDTGHLLGNIELACAMNDFRPHLMGGFVDEAINRMLYLDPEQEGVTTIMALADLLDIRQNLPVGRTALPSATQTEYPAIPDGDLLAYLHQATQIRDDQIPPTEQVTVTAKADPSVSAPPANRDKYNLPFCAKVSTVSHPISWAEGLGDLGNTILRRRSTRAYTGAALVLDELTALLDFTYQPQHYQNQGMDGNPDYFDLNLIQTFIAVSEVTGLEEGCYYYAPVAQELRQIRFKNFRRELHYLCLGQDLGRDAAAVVFHTADLRSAIGQYGDRAYRYLHLDAGHLGQRLNLAAIHLGLGVSGIGGFFDDQVNEVLGIPAEEAVLYITTLGRPRSAGA
ncbi:SagB-type dehydrogenase domain-containing protein [Leptolyngbya sp. 'hensonii']|uniref:SagB/ThcOx family dehydrogenase n=1 Tax=Leptolyngbya sp. 'hensonii' TaxID=1922337 RepID=UPI00094FD2A7|nr:SagB/ThcOx family dehydrogenase [Leptolyngbya sp. 'hensonii']OLP16773.1 SagB-type dehydrogenase domain-containing protein [Leptolyngbya sp. 'hensonii']